MDEVALAALARVHAREAIDGLDGEEAEGIDVGVAKRGEK